MGKLVRVKKNRMTATRGRGGPKKSPRVNFRYNAQAQTERRLRVDFRDVCGSSFVREAAAVVTPPRK